MEELDAGRSLLAEDLDLGLPPVGDDLGQTSLLDPRRLLPSIRRPVSGAAEVVPDRPLGDAEDSCRLRLRLASLLQDLDRHDLLPCELCQGGASQRALDVQDQLGSPWRTCRWMFSPGAGLNACQARNDLLPCERCQGDASELALDVQVQLESAWHACRWMFSTTAVLNACQARNDSGSLTPSFTGLVTATIPGGFIDNR